MKTAFILGITGQDGSYLAEYLLARNYTVHGLVRRASKFNRARIDHLRSTAAIPPDRLVLHYGDLNDLTSIRRLLRSIRPEEVYYLAAQSHVGLSFEIPEVTCQENAMATLGLLELLRDLDHPVRFYHAASSEVFGSPGIMPQTEETPFRPVNPYGCAKVFAANLCHVYRDAYQVFACSGIAYNHESPRRGESFVTRKISLGAAHIKGGTQKEILLGNLDAQRDWGWAPEYVVAMHAMLQQPAAQDFILATGHLCSVREFCAAAFTELGVDIRFEGQGVDEIGRRLDTGEVVLRIDPRFYRPLDSTMLVGDPKLARDKLNWSSQTHGTAVARLMARADYETLYKPLHRT